MKKTIFTKEYFCYYFQRVRIKESFLTLFFLLGLFAAQAQCPPFDPTVNLSIDAPGLVCGTLGPNVLQNPGFEEGLPGPTIPYIAPFPVEPPGWTMFGGFAGDQNIFVENPSVSPPGTSIPRSGAQHIKMFGSFNSPFNVNGFFQDVPTTPGDVWAGSIYMMTPNFDAIEGGENFSEFHLEFLDVNGCLLTGEGFKISEQFTGVTPTDEYFKITAIAEAPAGAVSVRFVALFFNVNFNGGAIYYDDGTLQKVEPLAPIVEATVGPGGCDFEFAFPDFIAQDESGIAVLGNNFNSTADPSGFYPIGQQVVTVTAEDNTGVSTSCSFEVIVHEFPDPLTTVVCNDFIHAALDENGEALIGADIVLEGGPYKCYDDFEVSLEDNEGDPVNNPLDCGDIGDVFTVIVTDPDTENSCWGELVVEDKRPPIIFCSSVNIPCTGNVNNAPKPQAQDNCSNVQAQLVEMVQVDDDPCDDDIVMYLRTWTAVDGYGNQAANCTDTLRVERPQDGVEFPQDVTWHCQHYNTRPQIINANKIKNYQDEDPSDEDLDVPLNSNVNGTGSGTLNNIEGTFCGYEFTHSDLTLSACGNSFKIVRTWTVLDWCAGQVITEGANGQDNVQVIQVMDKTAPNLLGSPFEVDVTEAGVHPEPCSSEGFLKAPNAFDTCNDVDVKIFTPIGEAIYVNGVDGKNGGYIPSPGLPQGTHIITYTATDDCSNSKQLEVEITIKDLTSPVAICDEITDVNLSSDGLATVVANVLDDGSYDNCCMDYFEIARMEVGCGEDPEDFGPSVTLCCEDAGDEPVILLFRAFDCEGNFNDCMVQVYVEDKLPPILVNCPSLETIFCDFYKDNLSTGLSLDDISVLDQFGAPTYQDNCELTIQQTFNDGVNECGEGNITRTWTVADPSGNNAQTCTQQIRVIHVSDWVIEFPADITVTCTDDVPNFGEPDIFFENCELIAVSYEDVVFNVVPDACFKIVRTWSVINWCVVGDEVDQEVVEVPESAMPLQYNDLDGDGIPWESRVFRDSWNGIDFPTAADAGTNGAPDTDLDLNPWDGYIEYEQIIKVIDNTAPVFADDCAIADVCIEDNTCGAMVQLPIPNIADCSPDVLLTAESELGSGFGPFFNVPQGVYEVTYSAVDNCGNSNSCQSSFEVLDCKLPTPYCKNGLVVELMTTDPAMVEIWASDFDAGSFDNCSGVQLSFSSDVNDISSVVTCDDLGQIVIQLWVTDASGNQDFCETFLIVQGNAGQCGDPLIVEGLIETEEEEAVTEVEVNINSNGGFNGQTMTGADGVYNFISVPLNSDYTITPIKDIDPLNGVSTFDLVLISKHILGVQTLDSPYKMIAADANNSNTITTFDMVLVRKLILFVEDKFPNNSSWRFLPKAYEFPDPLNPFAETFPEVINLNNFSASELDANFVAIKVGDVNNSAGLVGSSDDRNINDAFALKTADIDLNIGETYTIDFQASTKVLGYQFTLNFDKDVLEFIGAESGIAHEENFGFDLLNEGVITTSWHAAQVDDWSDLPLFGLTFTAKAAGRLSDLLQINSRYTTAEAYKSNYELMEVALQFDTDMTNATFELYQNTPNPFTNATSIGFQLPEASGLTLTITDISGKVLKVIQGEYSKGYHEISIEKTELAGSGVLYYQLETATETATRKMILISSN